MNTKTEIFFNRLRLGHTYGGFVELTLKRDGRWWLVYSKVAFHFEDWGGLQRWEPSQASYPCPKCGSYLDLEGQHGSCPECPWKGKVKLLYGKETTQN
jgi:hypothetical protein